MGRTGEFCNMSHEEWTAHGLKNNYHLATKSYLTKKASGFYNKGKGKWIEDFLIDKIIFCKMKREHWDAYFCENGYYNLTKSEFEKKARAGFIGRGRKLGIINEIWPKEPSLRDIEHSKLIEHCFEKGYDNLTRTELRHKYSYIYTILIDRKMIQEVIPEKKPRMPNKYDNLGKNDLFDLGRRKKFDLIPQQKIEDADKDFYNRIKPFFYEFTRRKRRPWGFFERMKTEKDAVSFFKDNYSGFTRPDVRKKDESFMVFLCKKGWADAMPFAQN